MSRITKNIRSVSKHGTQFPAKIIDTFNDRATARMLANGAIYRNLIVVGGPAEIGDSCHVDLTTPKPTIVMPSKRYDIPPEHLQTIRAIRVAGGPAPADPPVPPQPELPEDDITKYPDLPDDQNYPPPYAPPPQPEGGVYPKNPDGLRDAIENAPPGSSIYVPEGIYGNPEGNGRNSGYDDIIFIPDGVKIYGAGPDKTIIAFTFESGHKNILKNLSIRLKEGPSNFLVGLILRADVELDNVWIWVECTSAVPAACVTNIFDSHLDCNKVDIRGTNAQGIWADINGGLEQGHTLAHFSIFNWPIGQTPPQNMSYWSMPPQITMNSTIPPAPETWAHEGVAVILGWYGRQGLAGPLYWEWRQENGEREGDPNLKMEDLSYYVDAGFSKPSYMDMEMSASDESYPDRINYEARNTPIYDGDLVEWIHDATVYGGDKDYVIPMLTRYGTYADPGGYYHLTLERAYIDSPADGKIYLSPYRMIVTMQDSSVIGGIDMLFYGMAVLKNTFYDTGVGQIIVQQGVGPPVYYGEFEPTVSYPGMYWMQE
jgi:hypothetical protein